MNKKTYLNGHDLKPDEKFVPAMAWIFLKSQPSRSKKKVENVYECSKCKSNIYVLDGDRLPYTCPHCGFFKKFISK